MQGNTPGCGIRFANGNSHSYRNNIGGGNGSSGTSCIGAGNIDQGGNAGL